MLTFENVSFSYEKKQVLDQISFHVAKGEILAVMGPSGCGKTTLLSLAAGLKKPSSGEIRRSSSKISYVFQEPRLFPWLTVKENLEAVLKKPHEKENAILSLLEALELKGCEALYPNELSGGMKMRVSLARALIFDADLYLLDEPFSALDEELKITLSSYLRGFLKEKNAAAILVTHQKEDADRLADKTLILSNDISEAPSDH